MLTGTSRRGSSCSAWQSLLPSGLCPLPAMPTSRPRPQLLPPFLTCLVPGSCQAWRGHAGDGCRETYFPMVLEQRPHPAHEQGLSTACRARGRSGDAHPVKAEGEPILGVPALVRAGCGGQRVRGLRLDRLRAHPVCGVGFGSSFRADGASAPGGTVCGAGVWSCRSCGSRAHTQPLSAQRPPRPTERLWSHGQARLCLKHHVWFELRPNSCFPYRTVGFCACLLSMSTEQCRRGCGCKERQFWDTLAGLVQLEQERAGSARCRAGEGQEGHRRGSSSWRSWSSAAHR